MRRRNQVDIMASELVLQVEHMLRQLITCNFIRFLLLPFLTDLVVLTKQAAQVAVGKEYRSGAFIAGKSRFLSVVIAVRGDDGQGSRMAEPGFTLKAVDMTFPRTDIAGCQSLIEPFRPLFEFSGFV